MTVEGNDKSGEYMLEHYDVERAFEVYRRQPGVNARSKGKASSPTLTRWRDQGQSRHRIRHPEP